MITDLSLAALIAVLLALPARGQGILAKPKQAAPIAAVKGAVIAPVNPAKTYYAVAQPKLPCEVWLPKWVFIDPRRKPPGFLFFRANLPDGTTKIVFPARKELTKVEVDFIGYVQTLGEVSYPRTQLVTK